MLATVLMKIFIVMNVSLNMVCIFSFINFTPYIKSWQCSFTNDIKML